MEIPGNDVLDSSGSYGVPETPGNSLAFELMGGNKSEAAENPIDQETFLNNMELGREMEKLGKKPKTVCIPFILFLNSFWCEIFEKLTKKLRKKGSLILKKWRENS